MTDSLEKLNKLTKDMFTSDGVKIDKVVIQTVDDKLVEATILIKDAQDTLATAKEDRATDAAVADARDAAATVVNDAKDAAATIVSDAKDAKIDQLTADLKTAKAEIAQSKEQK